MTSTEQVKRFIREVVRIREQEHERKQRRQHVAERISHLKQLSLKKAGQKTIDEQFALLEREIQAALAAEQDILRKQNSSAADIQMLKDKVEHISRKLQEEQEKRTELQEIAHALERIHAEVRERKQQKRAFEKRSAHLEEKIAKKIR